MSKARDIADLDFNSPDIDGGNIDGATIGGTTPAAGSFSQVDVDNITSSGNLTLDVAGDIILDADGGDVILKDGGTEFMAFYNGTIGRTGDLTLDASGDIILDADGGDIFFVDAGVTYGKFSNASSSLQIKSEVSDADIIFKGNDGGTPFTALTLDMSLGGTAIFNDNVGIGQAPTAFSNWRVLELKAGSAGAMLNYENSSSARVAAVAYDEGSAQFRIQTMVDADIKFEPNNAVALTLDGSQNATFKGNVTIDNDSADPYLIIDGSTGNRDSGIKINSGGGERQALRQDNGNNLYIGNNALLINSSGNISTTGDLQSSGQITSARGSDTGTYGFRHEGAGKYMRMGVANASFAYFETDANGGFSFEGNVTVPNQIIHAGDTSNYMQFHQVNGWRVVNSTGERFHIEGASVVFNHDGHDADFRVQSDNQQKAIYVDGGNDSVQILGNKFLEPVSAYYISTGTLNRNITVDLNNCGEYYLIMHIVGIWPYSGSHPGTRIIEVTGYATSNLATVIRNTHYGSGPTGAVTVSATGNNLVVNIVTGQNYRWSAHCEIVHGGGGMSMSVDGNNG